MHGQFSGFQYFIFDLNSFGDVLSFTLMSIWLHTLEPTRAAVSIPYLIVQMFQDLNLNKFLGGYGHSLMPKISFMISRASFILNLNTPISNFCKLRSSIFMEPSFARSSWNDELWPWYTILKALSWMRLYGYLIFNCETFKQLLHKKIGMLWKHFIF